MRESSANILIEKIRKVFEDMREETGLPLVEPTFVLLASYIEPNKREFMRYLGIDHLILQPIELKTLREIINSELQLLN